MKIVQLTIGLNEVPLMGYIHEYNQQNPLRNIRPGIVICPGGAYSFVSDIEKDPVALYYFGMGFNVFLLEYSVDEKAGGLTPLLELSEALSKIRYNAVAFRTNPTKLAVMGFSAGAHLAGSLSLLHNNPEFQRISGVVDGLNSPDACILSYPVVTTGKYKHMLSIENVTNEDEKLLELLCLEKHVTSGCCPMFIWHTQDDETVPVQNSLLLLNALIEKNISCEFHMFPTGKHGLSMCNEECNTVNSSCSQWKGLSVKWLSDLFNFGIL